VATLRQDSLDELGPGISVPAYDRSRVSVGIVHIGPGAFHRAHEAAYVDSYLATGDPSWGICTVGLLPDDTAIRDVLREQDGLYTLLTVTPDGVVAARVIGSIVQHLHAPDDPRAVHALLADPATRIVSLTITEGGYGPDSPTDVFEFIVTALATRRAAGTPPFTVVSCDNIQDNGHAAAAAVTGAARHDPELAAWIQESVGFPSSMVDRITPVTTDATRAAARARGIDDAWPVLAESFAQWVVEDDFRAGRPELERVGVQVVPDVVPYEKMKLRLLNASHQAVGYLGLLSGAGYVHEACRNPLFVRFLRGYLREEAVPTLDPVPGVDVDGYCDQLIERFAGVGVQDTLARQVVDGSDRISKFLVPVIADQLQSGRRIARCALVLAAWSRFLAGETSVQPVDRRLRELLAAVAREPDDAAALLDYRPVFGDLGADPTLRASFVGAGAMLRDLGVDGALARLA
jgi:mannitol 2-dehydrogenase